MDSECLEQFSSHLQLDHLIEYVPNNSNIIDSIEGTIDLPSIEELIFKSKAKVETLTPETPTIINSSLQSFDSNIIANIESNNSKIDNICHKIIREMNYLGVSIIDNFFKELGDNILVEVINLYNTVDFTNGMLLNNNNNCYNGFRQIRGDFIHWVTGNESNCKNIRVLMKTLDTIVFRCNTMSNNGLMGVNSISSRTPAMIACYPGNGSGYMKHADNSNGDGRCITCIYYLNKDWKSSRDGGLLRVFPNQMKTENLFIDIEPVFDRLILFWSDRRNLHEVLPSIRMRFAITVWYFDEEERQRYRKVL